MVGEKVEEEENEDKKEISAWAERNLWWANLSFLTFGAK